MVNNMTHSPLMRCHKVTGHIKGQKTPAFCPQARGFILLPDRNQSHSVVTIGRVIGSVGFLWTWKCIPHSSFLSDKCCWVSLMQHYPIFSIYYIGIHIQHLVCFPPLSPCHYLTRLCLYRLLVFLHAISPLMSSVCFCGSKRAAACQRCWLLSNVTHTLFSWSGGSVGNRISAT